MKLKISTREWKETYQAACRGDHHWMEELRWEGFPFKEENPNYPLLVGAVKHGQPCLAEDLIKKGVNVNQRCPRGSSALHWAIYNNDSQSVDFLLNAGANPLDPDPDDGMTPLMYAALQGDLNLVKRLVKKGAGATQRDKKGRSAYLYCGQGECMEAARIRKAKENFIKKYSIYGDQDEVREHLKEIRKNPNFKKICTLLENLQEDEWRKRNGAKDNKRKQVSR